MNITHPYPSQEGKPPTSTSEAHPTNHQTPIHLNERSNVEPSLEDQPLVEEVKNFLLFPVKKKKLFER